MVWTVIESAVRDSATTVIIAGITPITMPRQNSSLPAVSFFALHVHGQ